MDDIITRYNYDGFTREKVFPLLDFDNSPPLGDKAPDFPLWHLDGRETSLSVIWSQHLYTIVEFGSFT
ncbi:MAG TPA: hypothetical protein EYP41_16470 [Anaerolineae bacterium]|nr:hypothetical protein [Anaerolineae bacterium]HIP69769.1 hypothetical protein [Anaerolineae bacterium]